MERLSPTSRFISVDLPTLGLPTIFTKPALCMDVIKEKNASFQMRFHVLSLLCSCLFFHCQLASIITALTTYCVKNVPCSTVRADCQCRNYCLIVGPSLRSSGFGLPSLRMCHFVLFLIVIFFLYFFQIVPSGVCLFRIP